MTQYIDKSVVIAEIERRKKCIRMAFSMQGILHGHDRAYASAQYDAFNSLLPFLSTLEVKEIGFDLGNNNKECHRVPSPTLKRLYMNEAKYELLKSDIMEGIVGDFEKGTTHNYLTIKIPMLLCPSNCAKGDKVKLIIIKEE